MVRKDKKTTSVLMTRLLKRSVFKSWLQFLAVILITGIAVTLYVGLTSNAASFASRVNKLYQDGNVADIWTTVTEEDTNDLDYINSAIGVDGKTETRYSISSKLNSFNATALISSELPTVNKVATTDNTATTDFFLIDERLLNNANSSQSESVAWKDENGNYASVPVNISFFAFRDVLKTIKVIPEAYLTNPNIPTDVANVLRQKTAADVFATCLKADKQNVFADNYLPFNFKITGSMTCPENVRSAAVNASSFYLDYDLLINGIKQLSVSNYDKPQLLAYTDTADLFWRIALNTTDIFDSVVDNICNSFKVNQYISKVGNGINAGASIEKINKYYTDKTSNNLLMCNGIDNLPSNVAVQSDIVQARQLAYIFPIVFFLVAILVVLTTLSQIILKDRIQIGTMKALGISKARITLHYLNLIMIVVGIGIAIGVILGPFILPGVMNQKYAILYSLPAMNYTISWLETILSTIVCLGISALVAYLVVRKEVNLTPSQSMRPAVPKMIKAKERDLEKKRSGRALSIHMAFRNIRINIAKSIMVIIGVMGCTALLVCGFGIDDTLNHGVEHDLNNFYTADIICDYSNNQSQKEELLSVSGVTKAEEFSIFPITVKNGNKSFQTSTYVVEHESEYFRFDNDYKFEGKIIVTTKVAREIGCKVGDLISFSTLGMNYSGEVGFVMDCFYLNGLYIDGSISQFSELSKIKTNVCLSIDKSVGEDTVKTNLSHVEGISAIRLRSENIELVNRYISSISLMTLTVKIFAILLAVVVLYNLALLNYKERIRDIATLKVLGFNRTEIARTLVLEIMFLTIIGVAFGLLLGMPMEILVLMVNITPLVEFLYTVYPLTYVISFLITIGTALIVNIWVANKTRKVAMVESLKSIE